MDKRKEDEEMIAHVIAVSDICAKRICPECKFMDEDGSCALIGEVPEAWADMIASDDGDHKA